VNRPLLLAGFMGVGKSTVGRIVASDAGVPFVDLDEEIVKATGKSIAEIFAEQGEQRFRQLEREHLGRVLSAGAPKVVALGGGALLRREVRLSALQRAVVVTLKADPTTLVERTEGDTSRPLLAGRDLAGITELMDLRAGAYAEAHESIDVGKLAPSEVARRVFEVWQRDPVAVAAGPFSYSVDVGQGFAPRRAASLVRGASKVVLITDKTVGALYGQKYLDAFAAVGASASRFELMPGEEHKNAQSLSDIWQHCLSVGADRKSWIVGVGGGVATDVAGFAAATWMRGVPWISVPTTLLGMVDASVGGKTAVDLPGAKNCVGAFWQPSRVLCDVDHLGSEPATGFAALSEVVKTALIGDPALLDKLEAESGRILARDWAFISEVVRRCVVVKARVVSEDARELGFRAALNLGHTVGHAIEACEGYGTLSHGEAVSLGLVAAMRIGEQLGITDQTLTSRVVSLLDSLGLPVDLSEQPLEAAAKLLGHDKKRGGDSVRFVFCAAPGRIEFRKLGLSELQQMVRQLA